MVKKKTGTCVIRCDEDVFSFLARKAKPFESRRAVLRRLLGFPPKTKMAPGPKAKGRKRS